MLDFYSNDKESKYKDEDEIEVIWDRSAAKPYKNLIKPLSAKKKVSKYRPRTKAQQAKLKAEGNITGCWAFPRGAPAKSKQPPQKDNSRNNQH